MTNEASAAADEIELRAGDYGIEISPAPPKPVKVKAAKGKAVKPAAASKVEGEQG